MLKSSDYNRTSSIPSEEKQQEQQREKDEEKQWDHRQKNSASVPPAAPRPQEFAISKSAVAVASSLLTPELTPPSHAFGPPTTTIATTTTPLSSNNLFSPPLNGLGNNNSENGQHKLTLCPDTHNTNNVSIINNNNLNNDNTPTGRDAQSSVKGIADTFVNDNCDCCASDNGVSEVKRRKFRKSSRAPSRHFKGEFAAKKSLSENTIDGAADASTSDCASEVESSDTSSVGEYSGCSSDSESKDNNNNNNNRVQSRRCCHCRRVRRKRKFLCTGSAQSWTAAAITGRCSVGAMMIQQQTEGMRRTRSEDDPEDRDLLIQLQSHRYSGGLGASIIDIGLKDNSSTDNSLAFHNAKFKRNSVAPSGGGRGRHSVSVVANALTNASKLQQQQQSPPSDEPEPLEAGCSEDDEGTSEEIVTINVSGLRFQTMEWTLRRYPHSLLGCRGKRKNYWNATNNEYFFDRHRTSFEAILHIYQTGGQVIRPESVPISLFLAEMSFYEMGAEVLENFWISEGYQKPTVDVLPANRWQRRVWRLMEHPDSSVLARVLAFVSVSVIIVSIASFCLETLPELRRDHLDTATGQREWSSPFFWIEFFCCLWFSIELFVRFASSPSKSRFMKSFLNVLDFVAVAPFFINILWVQTHPQPTVGASPSAVSSSSLSFSVLRIIRVVRVFRIFKLSRHSVGLQVLGKTFRASIQEFCLLIFFMAIACVLFSSGVYFAEQNEPDTKFTSIPASFWFVLATMTTVGYGDLVPRGVYGKVVGSCCALIGVLTLALPVPIIVANFKHFYRQECRLAQMYAQNKQLFLLPPDEVDEEYEEGKDEDEQKKISEDVEERMSVAAKKPDQHHCFVEDETVADGKRTADESASKGFGGNAHANCNITYDNNTNVDSNNVVNNNHSAGNNN